MSLYIEPSTSKYNWLPSKSSGYCKREHVGKSTKLLLFIIPYISSVFEYIVILRKQELPVLIALAYCNIIS